MIDIKTSEYYNKPGYYRFMTRSIFDALETAELEGPKDGQEIFAQVPEDDFLKMIADFEEYNNKMTNGSKDR